MPKFDRFSAGYYSATAQTTSDLIVYPTLLLAPGLLALNTDIRSNYRQVLTLYLETMVANNAVFTLTAGSVTRYRPYLYGPEGNGRTGHVATNSFYSGHTANTAAATFFAAKVYHDFPPRLGGRAFRVGRGGRGARCHGLLSHQGRQALPLRQYPGATRWAPRQASPCRSCTKPPPAPACR